LKIPKGQSEDVNQRGIGDTRDKSLKIPKGQSEDVNQRGTGDTRDKSLKIPLWYLPTFVPCITCPSLIYGF
jgi:hypothetical protein